MFFLSTLNKCEKWWCEICIRVCEILIKWWIWHKLTLIRSYALLLRLNRWSERSKGCDETRPLNATTTTNKQQQNTEHMYRTFWMYRMWATQLDICNIYTSKFCTKPRIARKERERERDCRTAKRYERCGEDRKNRKQHASRKHNVAVYIYCAVWRKGGQKEMCPLNIRFFFSHSALGDWRLSHKTYECIPLCVLCVLCVHNVNMLSTERF